MARTTIIADEVLVSTQRESESLRRFDVGASLRLYKEIAEVSRRAEEFPEAYPVAYERAGVVYRKAIVMRRTLIYTFDENHVYLVLLHGSGRNWQDGL